MPEDVHIIREVDKNGQIQSIQIAIKGRVFVAISPGRLVHLVKLENPYSKLMASLDGSPPHSGVQCGVDLAVGESKSVESIPPVVTGQGMYMKGYTPTPGSGWIQKMVSRLCKRKWAVVSEMK